MGYIDCVDVLHMIGGAIILFLGLSFFCWFYRSFLKWGVNVRKFITKDSWAVVTGASEGIGLGFSEELAKLGSNVVLISLDKPKLDEIAKRLQSEYNVETKSVYAIFGEEGTYERIEEELDGLNITILVNNVGINTRYPEKFLDTRPVWKQEAAIAPLTRRVAPLQEKLHQLVEVNILSALRMTNMVLSRMVENKKGLIISMSSFTADYPTPMMAVYSATKSFIKVWSAALGEEYRKDGIYTMSLIPFYVVSKMSNFRRATWTVCTGNRLAKDALRSIGTKYTVQPYWVHQIISGALALLPGNFLLKKQHSEMIAVRRRLIAREEKMKKKQN